jgi:hypothetical protein
MRELIRMGRPILSARHFELQIAIHRPSEVCYCLQLKRSRAVEPSRYRRPVHSERSGNFVLREASLSKLLKVRQQEAFSNVGDKPSGLEVLGQECSVRGRHLALSLSHSR